MFGGDNASSPKEVHVQILQICEYTTFYDKRDFADVVKLRTLRLEGYPGPAGLSPCDYKGLYKREAGGSEKDRLEDAPLLALKWRKSTKTRKPGVF